MKNSISMLFGLIVSTLLLGDESHKDIALAFEAGLGVGVDSFEKEYLVQGWRGDPISPMEFMVLLDTKNCSTKKILLLKDFGYRNGLLPVELSNHTILYKSFDNRPDADEMVRFLNRTDFSNIAEKVFVYQKKSTENFNKAPFAYRTVFEKIQKEIKSDVQVLVIPSAVAVKAGIMPTATAPKIDLNISKPTISTKNKEISKKPKIIKPPKPKISKISFKLKGSKVEYFVYNSASGASDRLTGKDFLDSNFKLKGVFENYSQTLETYGKIKSVKGISYVKVVGKNIYFDAFNTSLGE